MANSTVMTDWVSMKTLDLLTNKLVCAQFSDTSYGKEFTQDFPVGDTVRVKLPQRWTITDGLAYNPQAIARINTTATIQQPFGVHFEWDSVEQALTLERGNERLATEYLDKAAAQIAQEIDSRFAQFAYRNTPNIVGVLGTDPTAFQTVDQARQRMVELACPPDDEKGLLIPPAVSVALSNAGVAYFNPSGSIAKNYKEGQLGRIKGFDTYESMSLYDHTAGTVTTPTMKTANQSGSSIVLTCTTGDTFKQGDVLSIAAVYPTNPMTRRKAQAATTKQFVVTADTTAAAATATVSIYPAIFGPGSQYQNVDALPGIGAAVTLFAGTNLPNGKVGKQGLALTKGAFALVGVKMEVPKAVEMASQARDPQTGIAVRFTRTWDAQQSRFINRMETMIGFGVLYAENCAVRVLAA